MQSLGQGLMIVQIIRFGGLCNQVVQDIAIDGLIHEISERPAKILGIGDIVLGILGFGLWKPAIGASHGILDQGRDSGGQSLSNANDTLVIALGKVCLFQMVDDILALDLPEVRGQVLQAR